MVVVQNLPFFEIFFLGNIEQQTVFYDILEQKSSVQGYKRKKFKNFKSKN